MLDKSYLELVSKILAESGFAITIVGPDGPIVGTKADMLVIDDLSAIDRASLKNATFNLNYHSDVPIEMVDFAALEAKILAAWERSSMRKQFESVIRDQHVIVRKRQIQQKQWETKAAIKSRQLRNRQKGR